MMLGVGSSVCHRLHLRVTVESVLSVCLSVCPGDPIRVTALLTDPFSYSRELPALNEIMELF